VGAQITKDVLVIRKELVSGISFEATAFFDGHSI